MYHLFNFWILFVEWGMKSLGFKGSSSELSMVVGSKNNTGLEDEEPKLEDFLGGHSFTHHQHQHQQQHHDHGGSCVNDYMFNNSSLGHDQLPNSNLPSNNAVNDDPGSGGGGGDGTSTTNHTSSIGLSMIKTWLRNQPSPASTSVPQPVNTASSQSLSLSMSTAGGECSSSSENKQKTSVNGSAVVDAQSGASTDAVPRKSIDTFGQRTSIYRGVTRFALLINYFFFSILCI